MRISPLRADLIKDPFHIAKRYLLGCRYPFDPTRLPIPACQGRLLGLSVNDGQLGLVEPPRSCREQARVEVRSQHGRESLRPMRSINTTPRSRDIRHSCGIVMKRRASGRNSRTYQRWRRPLHRVYTTALGSVDGTLLACRRDSDPETHQLFPRTRVRRRSASFRSHTSTTGPAGSHLRWLEYCALPLLRDLENRRYTLRWHSHGKPHKNRRPRR